MAQPMEELEKDGLTASAYLVVEDPEQTSSWHLPVKDADGKADHRRMGAAWAALHQGYRGSKYEGPKKTDALRKLKALYKAEDMAVPTEAKEMYMPVGDALTLADAIAQQEAWELREQVSELFDMFLSVASNILWSSEGNIGPRMVELAQELADHLMTLPSTPMEKDEPMETLEQQTILTESTEPEEEPQEEPVMEDEAPVRPTIIMEEGAEPVASKLTEERVGAILEAQDMGSTNRRSPLRITTVLIRAGAGNAADKHWYSQEVLEAAAGRFTNAKMYRTQHVASEQTERGEASFVERVTGYDPDHGLVADVVAYDPDFCEKVRNLKDVGRLDMLQCSIYAAGTSRKGKINDQEFNVVQSIDEVYSVDWVTWAGAGGRAVEAKDVEVLDQDTVKAALAKTSLPEPVREGLAAKRHANLAELQADIQATTQAIAALIPSVKDHSAKGPIQQQALSEDEINKRVLAANKHFLGN